MIVYISTKLLLIGIIKNYNRGSFILAVISFAPAAINIVSGGLPIRMEKSSRLSAKIANRGNNHCAGPRTCRKRREVRSSEWSPISLSSEDPALENFPLTGKHLIDL
jgi:hypothetical protein